MRKIWDWFQELPEPYRGSAIQYIDQDLKDEECENLHGALFMGFDWDKTLEGGRYWGNLYNQLKQQP